MRLLAVYRLFLALLLVTLIHTGYLPEPLGETAPVLFNSIAFAYLCVALVSIYSVGFRAKLTVWTIYTSTCFDIFAFTLLMHASGGVSSGVGMLLVVSIASASTLLAGRMAVFWAALASLAVLGEQLYTHLYSQGDAYNYSMAGVLGLTLIVTSVLATVLARQARESADLAYARGVDLANMSALTEQVISQMSIGVLVVDQQGKVRLINEAARRLLDTPVQRLGSPLDQFNMELHLQLQCMKGQKNDPNRHNKWELETLPASLLVQIIPVGENGDDNQSGVLLFLEDAAAVNEQSQQLRLAALGRLTAGIAHEIRNPLSAIRHAGALLAESENLSSEEVRLTDIIQENTLRVNHIVEDVLQLGNRDRLNRECLTLNKWLPLFLEELTCLCPETGSIFEIDDQSNSTIRVHLDSGHLRQILNNLCQNALTFAKQSSQSPQVIIKLCGGAGQACYLEVINNGPPVLPEEKMRLFEPFFTTTARGTGLGLYLSRELAQANHCHLAHHQQQQHTCFRLSFSPQVIVESPNEK